MRYSTLFLIPTLLVATKLQAGPLGGIITDHPNTENRLPPPELMPKETPPPSFTLPPAEEKITPDKKGEGVKIQLNAVKFFGNTVFSEEELQEVAKPYLGKAIFLTDLEDLRQAITQLYTSQGFINSGAVIPEQSFSNGEIKIDIIEGRLSEIRVHGTEWLRPDYVKDRLARSSDDLLNVEDLRESFQMLLLDPLIERMNGELIPGANRGESILDVNVVRARPYQVSLTFDNYRPPSVGSDEGRLSGWVRNTTGFGDEIDWNVFYSGGSVEGSGAFTLPLNAYDTKFRFDFDISNTSVIEEPLKQIDIESEYTSFDFGFVQPFIQTLSQYFGAAVTFNYKENSTTLDGEPFPFSEGANAKGEMKESVFRFTLDFTQRWEQHVLSARSTTSVGINAFDATWHPLNSNQDGDFTAWLGQVQYAGELFDFGGTLVLRGDLQYTDDKLLPLEQFALGGRYSVRGYRENEAVRDKGYMLSAEYRYPLLDSEIADDFPGKLTLFPFFDYGAAWNRGDSEARSTLYSIGLGLEWQPVKYVRTEIIYAHGLNTAPDYQEHNLQDDGVNWQVTFSAF